MPTTLSSTWISVNVVRLKIIGRPCEGLPNLLCLFARRALCPLQRSVNSLGDEPKLRAARHPERRPWMMRQHEDGGVIRRLLSPPALPAAIRPGAPDGTKHITPENPGADSGQAFGGNIIVDARLATFIAVHVLPDTGVEKPVHQREPADPDRILKILVRPSTVAVD